MPTRPGHFCGANLRRNRIEGASMGPATSNRGRGPSRSGTIGPPCQGVFVLGFSLRMDRHLSHPMAPPTVAGLALVRRARNSDGQHRRRLRRSVSGPHLTKRDRRPIRPADPRRRAPLRPTPSVLLSVNSKPREAVLPSRGSSALGLLPSVPMFVSNRTLLRLKAGVELNRWAPRARMTAVKVVRDVARYAADLPVPRLARVVALE